MVIEWWTGSYSPRSNTLLSIIHRLQSYCVFWFENQEMSLGGPSNGRGILLKKIIFREWIFDAICNGGFKSVKVPAMISSKPRAATWSVEQSHFTDDWGMSWWDLWVSLCVTGHISLFGISWFVVLWDAWVPAIPPCPARHNDWHTIFIFMASTPKNRTVAKSLFIFS